MAEKKPLRRREVFVTSEFFRSHDWVAASVGARLVGIGLWSCADQCGCFDWDAPALSAAIGVTEPALAAAMDELASVGLLERRGDQGVVAALDVSLTRTGRFVGPRPIGSAWQATRSQVIERDGSSCRYCGEPAEPIEVDHVVPVSRGGDSLPDNLAVSCRPCNRDKGTKLLSEWAR